MAGGVTVPVGLELTWLLSCCAAEPSLDGILLLDLPERALLDVADRFVSLLGTLRGHERPGWSARSVVLGSHEDEDDLWSGLRVLVTASGTTFEPAAGPLAWSGPEDDALVVVVPDLARLSVSAARAATTMLDAPVVTLQRHGLTRTWSRPTYWLAGCSSADAGRLSPHLLDRFGVRFPAARVVRADDPVRRVEAALAGTTWYPEVRMPAPPPAWPVNLAADRAWPVVEDAAAERAAILHEARHGARRPLALLRLASAGARLLGEAVVGADHVDAAAALISLTSATTSPSGSDPAPEPELPVEPDATDQIEDSSEHLPTAQPQAPVMPDAPVLEPVALGDAPVAVGAVAAGVLAGAPFPEDVADPEHEAAPLRLPWQHSRAAALGRGTPVGTAPARDFTDLAWMDTLRNAALYQRFRVSRTSPAPHRLVVTGADLRQHRRVPQPEHMLVLVLDHTCRRNGWDWVPDLTEHLNEAYLARSAICLVSVGAVDSRSALRAERITVRSLLDPRVAAALDRGAGQSTPLAHGLELAHGTLRHALQHGGAALSRATVVVVTDGLGNVPLQASLADDLAGPVAGEGVADAVEVAARIAGLVGVTVVLVEPPAVSHPDVLAELAAAFGPLANTSRMAAAT